MSKVLVIQPTRGVLFTEAQQALETELASNGIYPEVLRTSDLPVPESRNALMEAAFDLKEWRYLLMLDDDVVMPEGSLEAMIGALSDGSGADFAIIDYPHHVSTVGGKKIGVAMYEDWKEGQKVEGKAIAWAGLGCVLAKRKALESLPRPLFKNSDYKYVRGEDGKIMMYAESRGNLDMTTSSGEDVYFWFEARKAGLKAKVLPGFQAGHARIEKFVYRLAGGKYRTSHKIAVNREFERPEL